MFTIRGRRPSKTDLVPDTAGRALRDRWRSSCCAIPLPPIPSFEFLLRERLNRLAHVRSESIARVDDVEHVSEGAKLAIISKAVTGVRLSRMLAVAEQKLLPLDVESALGLIHQLVTAMAELHDHAPDACHGTLAAERVIVTSNGRIVIVEHVLGAALAQLQHSPERYWKELRIALPIAVNSPLLDRRADVAQIGMIALALVLGRPIADDEYPNNIASLANGSFGLGGGFEPIPEWLRTWLAQALSLEPTRSVASAVEARHAFELGLKAGSHSVSQDKLKKYVRVRRNRGCDSGSCARACRRGAAGACATVGPARRRPSYRRHPSYRPAPAHTDADRYAGSRRRCIHVHAGTVPHNCKLIPTEPR